MRGRVRAQRHDSLSRSLLRLGELANWEIGGLGKRDRLKLGLRAWRREAQGANREIGVAGGEGAQNARVMRAGGRGGATGLLWELWAGYSVFKETNEMEAC